MLRLFAQIDYNRSTQKSQKNFCVPFKALLSDMEKSRIQSEIYGRPFRRPIYFRGQICRNLTDVQNNLSLRYNLDLGSCH